LTRDTGLLWDFYLKGSPGSSSKLQFQEGDLVSILLLLAAKVVFFAGSHEMGCQTDADIVDFE
jgi:hypothetical protein